MSNMLLRRHLSKRLSDYYSQPSNKVVGSIDFGSNSGIPSELKQPVPEVGYGVDGVVKFSSLWGELHWKRELRRIYNRQEGMWLTPCELFTPYYSNILANFIAKTMQTSLNNLSLSESNGTYEIVELGGGRGTNARALLNHLQARHRDMYDRLERYTIFDTSLTLHALQRQVLISGPCSDAGNSEALIHAHKIKLVNVDVTDIAEGKDFFLDQKNVPTAFIALELLDNLPHDKIMRCMKTKDILQAEVIPTQGRFAETFSPLNDQLLHKILSTAHELYAPTVSQKPRWVPTVALGLITKIFECRPNACFAFADFDWLPPPDISADFPGIALTEPALGDPLVTDMNSIDYACYLNTPPDALCDILFPTDFCRLASFVRKVYPQICANRETPLMTSLKQSEFLTKYGQEEVEKTKSWLTGYSPLIHDFANYSVLEVIPQPIMKK